MNTLRTNLSVKGIIDGELDSFDIKQLSIPFDNRYNKLKFELTYPLSVNFNGFIESADNWLDIINSICAVYKMIYNNTEFYGVWGHDISDLYIERLDIKNDIVEIFIGS